MLYGLSHGRGPATPDACHHIILADCVGHQEGPHNVHPDAEVPQGIVKRLQVEGQGQVTT